MSDEIRRLGNLVGDFDYPFHPHHGFLKTYKAVTSIFLCIAVLLRDFSLWYQNVIIDERPRDGLSKEFEIKRIRLSQVKPD